jgi:hypothetical protein
MAKSGRFGSSPLLELVFTVGKTCWQPNATGGCRKSRRLKAAGIHAGNRTNTMPAHAPSLGANPRYSRA